MKKLLPNFRTYRRWRRYGLIFLSAAIIDLPSGCAAWLTLYDNWSEPQPVQHTEVVPLPEEE
jgi:hypothetical protein